VESYLKDILDILDATEKSGRIDYVSFPNSAWNSQNITSEMIKDMEDNYLINIERAEDSSFKGITLASTGRSILRALKNKTVTTTLLTQAKDQGESPSVSYIVGAARRIAKEMDI